MGWALHVVPMREKRNVCWVLVGELEGKRTLGRYGFRWDDSFIIGFRKVGWLGVAWIDLSQDSD
jgi:hypothetical protein